MKTEAGVRDRLKTKTSPTIENNPASNTFHIKKWFGLVSCLSLYENKFLAALNGYN